MITRTASNGTTAATELAGPRSALVRILTEAYRGEIETVSKNDLSCTNRDGIRAERIASCMREAIGCDLDHAHRLAARIRRLHGPIPGPADFFDRPIYLTVPADPFDNVSALAGLIEAETTAVERAGGSQPSRRMPLTGSRRRSCSNLFARRRHAFNRYSAN